MHFARLQRPAVIFGLVIFTVIFLGRFAIAQQAKYRLSTFTADVTIPLGHRCMGVLPTKSKKIVDPLYAHGFVLLGSDQPIVLFPAEAFVGYQLMAQKMRPDSLVMSIGYGECWPGYIPLEESFADSFDDKWLWVAPGAEAQMRGALRRLLLVDDSDAE